MLSWLMEKWAHRAQRKALERTAAEEGVSREYLADIIGNFEAVGRGEISLVDFRKRSMQIAYQYPEDSRVVELLNREEWGGYAQEDH